MVEFLVRDDGMASQAGHDYNQHSKTAVCADPDPLVPGATLMSRLSLVALVVLALLAGQVRAQQAITAKSPDGKRIAQANGKQITVTDAQTNKAIVSIRAHAVDITSLAYSHDGKLLASADKDGKVYLFDISTGKALRSLKANANTSKIAFSADGRKLEATAAAGKRTFDVATGKEVK